MDTKYILRYCFGFLGILKGYKMIFKNLSAFKELFSDFDVLKGILRNCKTFLDSKGNFNNGPHGHLLRYSNGLRNIEGFYWI